MLDHFFKKCGDEFDVTEVKYSISKTAPALSHDSVLFMTDNRVLQTQGGMTIKERAVNLSKRLYVDGIKPSQVRDVYKRFNIKKKNVVPKLKSLVVGLRTGCSSNEVYKQENN
jgi:hypothetical protein